LAILDAEFIVDVVDVEFDRIDGNTQPIRYGTVITALYQ
jgi:hypothetical protein